MFEDEIILIRVEVMVIVFFNCDRVNLRQVGHLASENLSQLPELGLQFVYLALKLLPHDLGLVRVFGDQGLKSLVVEALSSFLAE